MKLYLLSISSALVLVVCGFLILSYFVCLPNLAELVNYRYTHNLGSHMPHTLIMMVSGMWDVYRGYTCKAVRVVESWDWRFYFKIRRRLKMMQMEGLKNDSGNQCARTYNTWHKIVDLHGWLHKFLVYVANCIQLRLWLWHCCYI